MYNERAASDPHPYHVTGDRGLEMRKLMLACLLLAVPAAAQDEPTRPMLEAGVDGGNAIACPGH